MRAALHPAARRLLDSAVDAATEAHLALWAVGGPIRDTALARRLEDIDLAVDGEAASIATVIATRLEATLALEPRFGTASVTLDGDRLDLASLRGERYPTPGALPIVTLGATIEDDLARRDFSVNAIAIALTGPRAGELLDPYSGLHDLASARFAVLHDRSFEDDATRLWRAARLVAQRNLRPHPHTRALIEHGARWLAPVSGHRLWTELTLIAQRGRAARTFALLDQWGVLAGTHPAFALTEVSRRALRHRWRPLSPETLAATLLAPLPPAEATAILDRLDAPGSARQAVQGAHALLAVSPTAGPDTLEPLASTTTHARTAARWLGGTPQIELQRSLRRWEQTRPHLNANDLLRLGIPPGPSLGESLRTLRRARYLGTLRSPSQARALIKRRQRATRSQP
ncbi:MAG: CCA tRNA nucleotidyltransferase [Dehalococcoidia bacterium]|nr:CCA tRNA nucleotidyltransferase [Dehalococcoidia bacterium]